jgi:hypothetical protein
VRWGKLLRILVDKGRESAKSNRNLVFTLKSLNRRHALDRQNPGLVNASEKSHSLFLVSRKKIVNATESLTKS